MPILYAITAGIVVSAVGLAWGLMMLASPTLFARISSVDWMADIVEDFARRAPWEIRLAGGFITALFGWILIVLILTLLR